MSARTGIALARVVAAGTLALVLGLGGCSDSSGPARPSAPTFLLRDVVHKNIDELTAAVAAEASSSAGAEADPDLDERLRGLALEWPGAQPKWRAVYRDEAASIGDPAVDVLAALVRDEELADGAKAGAIEMLAAVDTPRAATVLLELAAGKPEWVRRYAAYQLGETSQRWSAFPLSLRLNYETDAEAVVWIAHTLATFDNLSGLDGLLAVWNGSDERVRALAEAEIARIVEATGAGDAAALRDAWHEPGHALVPRREPTARERLEVWKLVLEISGERFQLRGVDDARFILSRAPEWVAGCLAEALHDADPWTRVHAAQCLDRMGARARGAAGELIAGLNEPSLAPAAAEALGGVGGPDAAPALARCLAPGNDHELRVAAARGLGRLPEGASERALAATLAAADAETPDDLRRIAAQSLARIGRADPVPFLLECLASEDADPHGAEGALEAWVRGVAAGGGERAAEVLAAWEELAPVPGVPATVEEVTRRQARRRELVAESLDALVAGG